MRGAIAFFAFMLALQFGYWQHTKDIRPDMSIVPDVPSPATIKALSFGDEQSFFRFLALQIQNSGDTFGRFTALYKYDYEKLYHWFRLLDSLDDVSNYVPSMATYYFGQTQNREDVKYIIDYLVEHSSHRVKEKWWWTVQAVYLADHRMKNTDKALKIANLLREATDAPLWAQQMPAFIYEKKGEMGSALAIIDAILNNQEKLSQGELNFMRYFVEERLGKVKELEAKLDRLQKKLDTRKEVDEKK